MTSFIESPRFPIDISKGSRGGPGFSTSVVTANSGSERRNQNWNYPRGKWDVACGVTMLQQMVKLQNFFMVVGGRGTGFRFHDPIDFKSCDRTAIVSPADCLIGTGTGSQAAFQLFKVYTQGAYSRSRKILKPIAGTVRVAVNGTEKTITTHWTVDTTTGIVTFTAGNLPAAGQLVTAGFEFDVPVRFDADELSISLDDVNSGAAQVLLIELKYGDT